MWHSYGGHALPEIASRVLPRQLEGRQHRVAQRNLWSWRGGEGSGGAKCGQVDIAQEPVTDRQEAAVDGRGGAVPQGSVRCGGRGRAEQNSVMGQRLGILG
jgi:hypothetical protein